MDIIEISNLTKDFGNSKGIFDINFSIKKGEVFGFLGPNGAGKTTTIRNLMGFIKPTKGKCSIMDIDCTKYPDKIQEKLGYLPGEIAFFDNMTGIEFLKFMAEMRKLKDFSRAEELIKTFEIDTSVKIRKMSKGMKQKIGIVCAFMHNPEILILDEPTSGLDPLMQNKFVDLILHEKKKGATILMSSHIFEEIERTCDRIGIIKEGHMVAIENIDILRSNKIKKYVITLKNNEEAEKFSKEDLKVSSIDDERVIINVKDDYNNLITIMSKYDIKGIDVVSQSIEDIFMNFYGGKEND